MNTPYTHFVGIDPGATGAIAVMNNDVAIVVDMPVHKVKVGKTNRYVPDWKLIFYEMEDCREFLLKKTPLFVIERSQPMPRDGCVASWSTGRFFGGLEGIIAALSVSVQYVRPSEWKRHFGLLKQTKDASRKKAMDLYPLMSDRLKLKKHHGRAEAILIAHYAMEKSK